MFVRKQRLEEAERQIEAYKGLVATQAEFLTTLRTWHSEHVARLERQNAINEAVGTVAVALDRHPGDDMSGHPVLAAAVLLSAMPSRTTAADDALIALAKELHDPLAEAIDAILG
jgi:hypothetical protein